MKIAVLFCAFLLVAVQARTNKERSAMAKTYDFTGDLFKEEYIKFIETGVKTHTLENLFKILKAPVEIRREQIENLSDTKQSVTCAICKSAVDVILKYRRDGKPASYIRELAVSLCVNMNIQPKVVCDGLIDKMLNTLLFIIDNRATLKSGSICGTILQGTDCYADGPEFEWAVEISPEDEGVVAPKGPMTKEDVETLNIVHISDIHFDPEYKVGSMANCPEPMCCRRTDVNITNPAEGAGFWGDYRSCDLPLNGVEAALNQIVKQHPNIDYIYYTGDYIDHAVWSTGVEYNKNAIKTIDSLFKQKFKNIPVFPLIGNHEPDPLNLFAPDYVKEQGLESGWMYNFLADDWAQFLPESALTTVRKGGYYTVSPREGFRIIGINNNDGYTYNFWLMFDPSYLRHQLQWLQDTLFDAEQAGEYVHILAHIPSGSGSCHVTWSREFRRIVDRYHKTISGIFNGHTHKDHFHVYFSKTEPSYPIGVAWNGGSVTPYSNVNPNYHIYGVETETYQVAQHETWIMNLTLANEHPEKTPVWVKEYTFADAYGATDLSPVGLEKLLVKFANDKTLLKKYWAFKGKMGDPFLKAGCGNGCLKNVLCDMATTQTDDFTKCDEYLEIFSKNFE